MDTILIEDLEGFYHVGVPDEERSQPQRLLISIEMEHDFSAAAENDELGRTIDYFAVSQRLLRFGEGRSWRLIEKLALDIADVVLREFGARQVTVTVKKFVIPQARHVAVSLVRRAG
jgi:7,8-dihydroneopterin aldolase/epimerase/oxygenase